MYGDNVMNTKGEQGGIILGTGQSYTAGANESMLGFTCIGDVVLTSLAMNYTGANTKLITPLVITDGSFVAGQITQVTVASGLIALHAGRE